MVVQSRWATEVAGKKRDGWEFDGLISAHDIAHALQVLGDDFHDATEGILILRAGGIHEVSLEKPHLVDPQP